jgi:hypothetical protein
LPKTALHDEQYQLVTVTVNGSTPAQQVDHVLSEAGAARRRLPVLAIQNE